MKRGLKLAVFCLLVSTVWTLASVIPGPGEEGFDLFLWEKAKRWDDRVWTCLAPEGLALWLEWDSKENPTRMIKYGGYSSEAMFGGSGAACDAMRYAITGLERDRIRLLKAIRGISILQEITGVRGLIARAFWTPRMGQPDGEPVPLFDENGNPLPEPKVGVWRNDNSEGRKFPGYLWLDDVSRDQYCGYMYGLAVIHEVIKDDPTIPQMWKDRVKDIARGIGEHMMTKRNRPDGKVKDLMIIDADGRRTEHGNWNEPMSYWEQESDIEPPGFNALCVLSFVKTIAHITGEKKFDAFYKELLEERDYKGYASRIFLNFRQKTNYNNYNMAFMAIYPLILFETDPSLKQLYQYILEYRLWTDETGFKMVKEQKNPFWNMIFLAVRKNGYKPGDENAEIALADTLDTLYRFAEPPFWMREVKNSPDYCECDEWWCENRKDCIPDRGGNICAVKPVPWEKRPPSNFMARNNPYQLDGGYNAPHELPGTTFRNAYWLGRFHQRNRNNLYYKPRIMVAGYMMTRIINGKGNISLMALVNNTNGPLIDNVQLLYQGNPTGIKLTETSYKSNIYSLELGIIGANFPAQITLELLAKDMEGNESLVWPYLTVRE